MQAARPAERRFRPQAAGRLQVLLALRQVTLPEDFFQSLRRHAAQHQQCPLAPEEFQRRLQTIWQRLTPAQMREKAIAIHQVPLSIPPASLH